MFYLFLYIYCFRLLKNKKMLYCSVRILIFLCIVVLMIVYEDNEICKLLFFIF